MSEEEEIKKIDSNTELSEVLDPMTPEEKKRQEKEDIARWDECMREGKVFVL